MQAKTNIFFWTSIALSLTANALYFYSQGDISKTNPNDSALYATLANWSFLLALVLVVVAFVSRLITKK